MRLPLAVLLVAASAAASTVTFSVTATNGPFPAVINSETSFTDQEFITITVEPDAAVEAAINPLVDAIIDFYISYTPVGVSSCTAGPCGGLEDYYIYGYGVDSGIEGDYSGPPNAFEDVEPFGNTLGSIYLSAGTYTFEAYAQTMVEGQGVVVNPDPFITDSYASITGVFTVVDGDVSLGAPEPGLWPLCLLLLASLLKFSRYRKAHRERQHGTPPLRVAARHRRAGRPQYV